MKHCNYIFLLATAFSLSAMEEAPSSKKHKAALAQDPAAAASSSALVPAQPPAKRSKSKKAVPPVSDHADDEDVMDVEKHPDVRRVEPAKDGRIIIKVRRRQTPYDAWYGDFVSRNPQFASNHEREPEKISLAGIVYVMETFPPEVSNRIASYLIRAVDPWHLSVRTCIKPEKVTHHFSNSYSVAEEAGDDDDFIYKIRCKGPRTCECWNTHTFEASEPYYRRGSSRNPQRFNDALKWLTRINKSGIRVLIRESEGYITADDQKIVKRWELKPFLTAIESLPEHTQSISLHQVFLMLHAQHSGSITQKEYLALQEAYDCIKAVKAKLDAIQIVPVAAAPATVKES